MKALPLLLALLLLAAGPARALDEGTFLGYVKHHARELKESFPDEVGRLTLAPPELVDAAGGYNGSAEYDGMLYKVKVSRKILAAAESEVKTCKNIPEGMSVEWVLAIHFLPTYMHELRHSRNHGELGEIGNNLEEEMSGFITSMAAYRAVRQRWPQAYNCGSVYSTGDYQMAERYWKPEGVPGLKKMLRASKLYGKACSVLDGDQPTCCRLSKERFARLAPLHEALGKPGADAAAACSQLADKIKDDSCKDKDSATRLLWDSTAGKNFWCSDATMTKARQYYNDKELPRGNAEFRKQL